jgi:hypothetical protein
MKFGEGIPQQSQEAIAAEILAKCQEYVGLLNVSVKNGDYAASDSRKRELQKGIYRLFYNQEAPENLDEETVAGISDYAKNLVLKKALEEHSQTE